MPKLNHTWEKDKDFKPSDGFYERHICKRCGCEKDKGMIHYRNGFKKTMITCSRSGIVFELNRLPECIDWNDNTLD